MPTGVGYVPRRGELLKTSPYYTGTKKPDVCEVLILQRDWGPGSETRQNPWPDHMPLFRQAVQDFFEATEDLAIQMLPLYALALGLERDFFAHKFRKYKALNALRVSYMPPDTLTDDEFQRRPTYRRFLHDPAGNHRISSAWKFCRRLVSG